MGCFFNVKISEAVCCCCGTLLLTDATWKSKFFASIPPPRMYPPPPLLHYIKVKLFHIVGKGCIGNDVEKNYFLTPFCRPWGGKKYLFWGDYLRTED